MSIELIKDQVLVLGTHNEGKKVEFQDLLAPFGLKVHASSDYELPEPEETGTTFEENALLKASYTAQKTGQLALADDSGLAVAALDGRPGIFSARWAGESKNFAVAMQKVQDELLAIKAHNEDDRKAAFVCVLCLANPNGQHIFFRGEVKGTIIWPPQGEKGFGYDPIFRPEGATRTYGDMTREEKHGQWWKLRPALSHRGRAFRLMIELFFGDIEELDLSE